MKQKLYPINCIVAATDFTTVGDLAVRRGAYIAQQCGKVLHLLHVVHPLEIYPELMFTFNSHAKDYERLKRASGLESLDQLAVKIRNEFGIKVNTATRIGRPYIQIAEYSKDESADLIIVGFNTEKNLLDAMLGSTGCRLLRAVQCSVLIARNQEAIPYKRALAAVDFTMDPLRAPTLACKVAPSAHVEILHVFDLKQETLSRGVGASDNEVKKYRDMAIKHVKTELNNILDVLDDEDVSSLLVKGYLPDSINSRVVEFDADLVVLGKNSKNSLEEYVLGSVSKGVADMVNCDVLLV